MTVIEIHCHGERRHALAVEAASPEPFLVGESWRMRLNGRWDDTRTIWYEDR